MADSVVNTILLFLGVLSIVLAESDNETVASDAGIYVKVLGYSGKIMMSRSMDIETDEKRIVVQFDEIKEKAENGDDVGKSGNSSQKHGFNTFTSQQFEFSEVSDGIFENISAKYFNCTAYIASGAKLTVDVYIFSENGTFSLGGENTTVSEGSVKFNIRIDDWMFCGDPSVECRQGQTIETGKYLDFTIAIKGKGASPQKKMAGGKRTTAEEYELGGGNVVIFKKVQYDDGDWVDTPTGYPKIEIKGSKQLFVFRFDKFSKSVMYDTQIDLDPSNTSPTVAPSPADSDASVGNIHVKVLGRSGKIQLGNQPNPSSDPNRITIEFSELKEKLADGESDIKDNKHKFNNFAKTDFEFTPPVDAIFMNSTRVRTFTFNCTLNDDGATLETVIYIFKEDGNITLGDEGTLVQKGNMKFSTTIKNWGFCGQGGVASCTQNQVGEYLDFSIVIKGKGTPNKKSNAKKKDDADEYELGEGSAVSMPKKVRYNDGLWEDMATGYPKMVTKGSKQIFLIRLKKFTGSAYYDPTLIYSTGDTGGSSCNHGSWLTFIVFTAVCLFLLQRTCTVQLTKSVH